MSEQIGDTPRLPYPGSGATMRELSLFDQDLVKALFADSVEIRRRANDSLQKSGAEPMTGPLNLGGFNLVDVDGVTGDFYEAGTFTPTIRFATLGDLSVAYSVQDGQYIRVGKLLCLDLQLTFTPTFTTSSGFFFISSLPAFTAAAPGTVGGTLSNLSSTGWVWPASTTMVGAGLNGAGTETLLRGLGSGVATLFNATHLTSGASHTIALSMQYKVT